MGNNRSIINNNTNSIGNIQQQENDDLKNKELQIILNEIKQTIQLQPVTLQTVKSSLKSKTILILETIPFEVWNNIFQYLFIESDICNSLFFVCKYFYELCNCNRSMFWYFQSKTCFEEKVQFMKENLNSDLIDSYNASFWRGFYIYYCKRIHFNFLKLKCEVITDINNAKNNNNNGELKVDNISNCLFLHIEANDNFFENQFTNAVYVLNTFTKRNVLVKSFFKHFNFFVTSGEYNVYFICFPINNLKIFLSLEEYFLKVKRLINVLQSKIVFIGYGKNEKERVMSYKEIIKTIKSMDSFVVKGYFEVLKESDNFERQLRVPVIFAANSDVLEMYKCFYDSNM
ncbi:hypothetical protein ABK040_001114 [Willaertia magna]